MSLERKSGLSYDRNEHQTDKSALEIKTSSVEGRYKTTNKDFDLNKIMSIGFFDKDYGICRPRVRVTYRREYYKIYDVRLTIDRNIEYLKLNTKGKGIFKKYDPDIIVEVKADDIVPLEYLFQKFHFDRIRFSKYSKAINSFLA